MPPKRPVYISYAWGDDSPEGQRRAELVDRLYESLKSDGFDVRLDKAEMGYKDLISHFMENLGAAPCVVAVISEKYLRSDYCMFELWRTWHNAQFRERLCPILLPDASLLAPRNRAPLVKHWAEQEDELATALRELPPSKTSPKGLAANFDRVRQIAHDADEILSFLADMNTLSPEVLEESGFSRLKEAITQALSRGAGATQ